MRKDKRTKINTARMPPINLCKNILSRKSKCLPESQNGVFRWIDNVQGNNLVIWIFLKQPGSSLALASITGHGPWLQSYWKYNRLASSTRTSLLIPPRVVLSLHYCATWASPCPTHLVIPHTVVNEPAECRYSRLDLTGNEVNTLYYQ